MSISSSDYHAVSAMHVLMQELVSGMPPQAPVFAYQLIHEAKGRAPHTRLSHERLVEIATQVAIGQARAVVFDQAG